MTMKCIHFSSRLCSLTLTRLVLHKPLGADLNSVIIAVKMQVRSRYFILQDQRGILNGYLYEPSKKHEYIIKNPPMDI